MHIYRSAKGHSLPSVTEIIGKTRPLSETIKMNASIKNKMEREGMSQADWNVYMKKAQQRGTKTHEYMELYLPVVEEANSYVLDGKAVPDSLLEKIRSTQEYWESVDEIGCYVKSLNNFVRDLNRRTRDWSVVSAEENLVNEEYGYGGKSDALFRIGDNKMLIDYKTNGGYWSSWQNKQVYDWNVWRKPKKVDCTVVKQLANGGSRTVKKRDAAGKIVRQAEEMPPIEERGWEWVDTKMRDKFVQLALYILASHDMKKRGQFEHDIYGGAIVVAFPGSYQFLEMPRSVWEGCREEAIARVKRYMSEHLEKWKLEALLYQSNWETRLFEDAVHSLGGFVILF